MAAKVLTTDPVPKAVEHVLPRPFRTTRQGDQANSSTSSPPITIVTQGAEALLYRTTLFSSDQPCALKFRPSKSYRHSILDARLTKARVLAEARVLLRCRREGVPVPAVLALDWEEGWLCMEWIDGVTVRRALDVYFRHGEPIYQGLKEGEVVREEQAKVDPKWEKDPQLIGLMRTIGQAVGRLHATGIVHGDLTTSNLMLKAPQNPKQTLATEPEASHTEQPAEYTAAPSSTSKPAGQLQEKAPDLEGDVVLIDFGLAQQTVQDEDKAVDLYVLERAFGSTHPEAEGLFGELLNAYGDSYKGTKAVLRRLDDVRLRGRKKSMLG